MVDILTNTGGANDPPSWMTSYYGGVGRKRPSSPRDNKLITTVNIQFSTLHVGLHKTKL